MRYMKNIYTLIKELYPNNPKKVKELSKDFKNWVLGEYPIPKTQEVRDLISKEM